MKIGHFVKTDSGTHQHTRNMCECDVPHAHVSHIASFMSCSKLMTKFGVVRAFVHINVIACVQLRVI